MGGNSEVKQIAFYFKNPNQHQVLVSTAEQYFSFDLNKQVVHDQIIVKKKQ